ncbi:MAG: hypothetical protein R2797_06230 [Gelidibacter sp.]
MRLHSVAILLLVVFKINAQDILPYHELPEYPESFTAGTMAARMVDALGFRYYWATEDLKENDLAYKPNDDARSTGETIDHILSLSHVIVNSTLKRLNAKNDFSKMSFDEKRKQTLLNLKTAADILRTSDDISQFKIIFGEREIPFLNNVNGPIADAIWHCGQIASFRRSSGNPINPRVDHFMGTVKD